MGFIAVLVRVSFTEERMRELRSKKMPGINSMTVGAGMMGGVKQN